RLEHQNQDYNQIHAPNIRGPQYAPNYIIPSQDQLLTTPVYQATQSPQMLADSYSQFQLPSQQTFSLEDINTRHPVLVHSQENTSQVIASSGNIQHNVFSPMQQLSMHPALMHSQENTSQVIASSGNIQHNVFSPMQQLSMHPALVHSQENTSQVIGSGGHIHHNVFSPMQQLPMFPNRPDQMIYNVGMSNSNFQPQNAPLHEPTTLSFGIPTSEELSLRILGHSDKGPTEENSLRKAEIAEQRNNEVRSQVVSWDEVPRNTQIASCNEVPANSQIVSLDEVLANSQNISWDEILANIETVSRNEVHANQRNKGKGKLLESPSTGLEHRNKNQLVSPNICDSQDSPNNMPPQMMQQVAPVATTDGVQANQCDKGKLPESPSTRIHSGTIKRITYIIPNQTVTVVPSSSPATQQNQREMVVNQKVDDPAKQGKKENEPVLPKRRGRPPKPRGQGGNNVSKITKKQKTGSSSAVSGNAETISTPQQQQMTHGNVSNVSNVQTRRKYENAIFHKDCDGPLDPHLKKFKDIFEANE
ncbi:hypothetical protein KIW84_053968, partial [Lathyrus oleraceus]